MKYPLVRRELVSGTYRSYEAARYYDEGYILGAEPWEITTKIDGIRLFHLPDGRVVSRNGKEQSPMLSTIVRQTGLRDMELFGGTWARSMSLKACRITPSVDNFFSLVPLDPRLNRGTAVLTHELLMHLLQQALDSGFEGLVIRQGDIWLKVVPLLMADIRITGYKEGKGKYKHTLGSIETDYCNVSGMGDDTRRLLWDNKEYFRNKIIQVSYRERTVNGKLRFVAFERFRPDKDEESI
jgi:hypothetical protein